MPVLLVRIRSLVGCLDPVARLVHGARGVVVGLEGLAVFRDGAIPLTGQDHMIAAVDGAIGGKTTTHTLESSHSPFLSQPSALSKILMEIGVQSLAEAQ